mmetsp:Transcript_46843/g.124434  ORF Transcript_46843/g.124434 Transcript_46843/m.124434 type:complete len:98 (+) Transcript_46843:1537-1830(+)
MWRRPPTWIHMTCRHELRVMTARKLWTTSVPTASLVCDTFKLLDIRVGALGRGAWGASLAAPKEDLERLDVFVPHRFDHSSCHISFDSSSSSPTLFK